MAKRLALSVAVATVLAMTALARLSVSVRAAAQPPQRRVRTILWAGEPIRSLLLPDDEIVRLDDAPGDVLIAPQPRPTRKHAIEDSALAADFVGVVDLHAANGLLTRGDSWVDTRLTWTVRKVWRVSKNHEFQVGQQVETREGDGELQIGNVLVQAGAFGARYAQWPIGQSYVLFLNAKGSYAIVNDPPLIQNGRLVSPPGPGSALKGMTLKNVEEIVRRAKASRANDAPDGKKP